MLEMRLQGRVERYPEGKVSAKGVHYCRVTVEVTPSRSQYSKKINLTGFGDIAQAMERHLSVGDTVEVVCEPQAKAWLSKKNNEPQASLEGIIRTYKVLTTTAKPVIAAPETNMTDEDIPF